MQDHPDPIHKYDASSHLGLLGVCYVPARNRPSEGGFLFSKLLRNRDGAIANGGITKYPKYCVKKASVWFSGEIIQQIISCFTFDSFLENRDNNEQPRERNIRIGPLMPTQLMLQANITVIHPRRNEA